MLLQQQNGTGACAVLRGPLCCYQRSGAARKERLSRPREMRLIPEERIGRERRRALQPAKTVIDRLAQTVRGREPQAIGTLARQDVEIARRRKVIGCHRGPRTQQGCVELDKAAVQSPIGTVERLVGLIQQGARLVDVAPPQLDGGQRVQRDDQDLRTIGLLGNGHQPTEAFGIGVGRARKVLQVAQHIAAVGP